MTDIIEEICVVCNKDANTKDLGFCHDCQRCEKCWEDECTVFTLERKRE